MHIPGADHAVVDVAKLVDYALSPQHPRGLHKARVFERVLGLTRADAGELRDALLAAAKSPEAHPGPTNEHGARFVIDFRMSCRGRSAVVRSAWIVRAGENFPRFLTCYIP